MKKSLLEKVVRTAVREALGVPDNVVQMGQYLYEKVFEIVRKDDSFESLGKRPHLINGDFNISDFEFKTIKVSFEFDKVDFGEPDKHIAFAGMAYIPTELSLMAIRNQNDVSYKLKRGQSDVTVDMRVSIYIDTDTTYDEFLELMQGMKSELTSSFSHELKHAYDFTKQKTATLDSQGKYSAVTNISFGNIPPVSDFLYLMYYVHDIENSVRPTELAADIAENGISQNEFKGFILKHKIYETLNKAKEFSYEGLKSGLRNMNINGFLLNGGMSRDQVLSMDEDEKLEKILEGVYNVVINTKGKVVTQLLKGSPFEQIFKAENGRKEAFFQRYLASIQKGGYKGFYEKEIKFMNIAADKMMRKLAGLFAYIPMINAAKEKALPEKEQILMLLKFVKTGDKSNIEIAYAIAEGLEVDMDVIIEKYYGDVLRRNKLEVSKEGLMLYFEKKNIGLI